MDIVIHVGMPRTATTFLQQEIFPKLDINFVNFYEYNKSRRFAVMSDKKINFILLHMERYSDDEMYKALSVRMIKNKINLISDECIYFGEMFSKDDNRFNRINKIKRIFPDAKIIIGVRDKQDAILSWYNHYIAVGGILSFKEFKDKHINPDKFDYKPYVEYLYKLFGRENVYVYHFEDIKKNVYDFVSCICSFIGVDTPKFRNVKRNVGYSLWQLKLSRCVNRLFKTNMNPNGIIPIPYQWHPHRIIFQSPYFPKWLRGKKK